MATGRLVGKVKTLEVETIRNQATFIVEGSTTRWEWAGNCLRYSLSPPETVPICRFMLPVSLAT